MIRVILALVIGGLPASQAVPFTEAYLHNLDGRVAELRLIVDGYVDRADARGATLRDHIQYFVEADDPLVRDEGQAMRQTVDRYNRLRRTADGIATSPPILHPILVAQHLDEDVARSVADRFNPGVSASVAQLFYFAAGLLLVWIVLSVLLAGAKGTRRLARRPKRA